MTNPRHSDTPRQGTGPDPGWFATRQRPDASDGTLDPAHHRERDETKAVYYGKTDRLPGVNDSAMSIVALELPPGTPIDVHSDELPAGAGPDDPVWTGRTDKVPGVNNLVVSLAVVPIRPGATITVRAANMNTGRRGSPSAPPT